MKYNTRYRKLGTFLNTAPSENPTPMTREGTRAMVERFRAFQNHPPPSPSSRSSPSTEPAVQKSPLDFKPLPCGCWTWKHEGCRRGKPIFGGKIQKSVVTILVVFVVTWKLPVEYICGDSDYCRHVVEANREKKFEKEEDAKKFVKEAPAWATDLRINGVAIDPQNNLYWNGVIVNK